MTIPGLVQIIEMPGEIDIKGRWIRYRHLNNPISERIQRGL